MLERFKDSDGLGAIFPPIVNSIFALRALDPDDELISRQVGTIVDVEDLVPSSYVLEVSSPGLDWAIQIAVARGK